MNQIDIKSVLIGFLGSCLIFVLIAADNLDSNNKNMNNHLVHDYKRNIFTSNLAPSTGSLTENYLKAKTLLSPVYRNNEAIAKYESISMAPIKLAQVKKDLNRII